MMNTEIKTPVNPTTEAQENKPDAFDRFAAWAKPQLTRLGGFLWDNKEFFAQVALADMDSRRTQRNVRRVIERRQEIEMQTPSLHLKTTIPQPYPALAPRQARCQDAPQQRLPQGQSEKES